MGNSHAHKAIQKLHYIVTCCLIVAVSGKAGIAQDTKTDKADDDQQQLESLTVDQAINEAIKNNLGLQAEQINVQIAESSVITAKLRPNPVVSLADNYLFYLNGYNLNKGANPSEIAGRIDFPIEHWGKRRLRMKTAEYNKTIADTQLLDSIRKLKLEVAVSCTDVLQAKANLSLVHDNLKTFEDLVRINDARVKAGSLNPLDLARSKVAMLQFQNNVKHAELELSKAKIKLQNLLGRKKASGTFDIIGELKYSPHKTDLDLTALQEAAITTRPDLRAIELAKERSQSDTNLQHANAKVDYTVGVQYQRTFADDNFNSMGLSFSVPLPIYNRNQGEIARAHAEHDQFARRELAVKTQILNEVKTAYYEFCMGRELVENIERNLLNPAEEARNTAAYIYRTGASSLVEFLDAQRAFNETKQSYNEAQATYCNAIYNLNAAVGKEIIP